MEYRGIMGGFYRISEWVMRFSVTNLLWLLCSSPFFFFALTKFLVMANNLPNESLQMNWALAISAPFTLFPATAALFSVARKWVMGDTDVKLLKTYFKSYKDNYKQAMIGGIFYTLLFIIMYVDYTVYMTQFDGSLRIIGWAMLGLLVVLFISLFNFFSMVSHYHMKTLQILKNSVLITLFRPVRIIITAIVAFGLLYFGVKYPFIIVFFAGSMIAYVAFFNFYATYQKMQDQHERMKEQEEEDALKASEEGEAEVK